MVAADEVGRLQRGSDPECRLAQKVFEQGHYAGRTTPSDTRQGTYALTPTGILLGSMNRNDAAAMAELLRRSLDKWNSLSLQERMVSDAKERAKEVKRYEDQYPAAGLVLRVFSRDLPREQKPADWRADAWNQDYAWFRPAEVSSMMPSSFAVGQKSTIPEALVKRLVQFNLVDNVRGQVWHFPEQDVKQARMTAEVIDRKGDIATLRVTGETRAESEGSWSIAGYRDMNSPSAQKRGVHLKLYGTATYNSTKKRFTSFDVVALGNRHGATQYNGRHDDLGPAPIGFLVTLAGNSAAEKVAPAFFYSYSW
ncbi:MAG TPA: hypothetical protein VK934_13445 [Fimbriimonas sp.]|nr:hypothetical protein [Fimbriimonas sp.]